ncbi:hypothetical protein [Alkalibacillus haloalkaliphilus]|uniref:hypothetical protein n=1 Tax=Alkalibacillus haloalkaliphilus TaxID=94136 RepID=UPI00030224C7|nr:hypothetical protein [Alkalibacillus haloalkaliphilus]
MRKMFLVMTFITAYAVYHFSFHYLEFSNTPSSSGDEDEVDEHTYAQIIEEDYLEVSYSNQVIHREETDLVAQYEEQFNELEQSILSDIESLKDDVLDEVGSGQNIISQGFNLLKYEREANEIEEKADRQFETLIAEMESAANDHLIPEQTIDEFKEEYEARKDNIKTSIFKEVNSWLEESEAF